MNGAWLQRLGLGSKADLRFAVDDAMVLSWNAYARASERLTVTPELREALRKNAGLKGRFRGQRCWIIGNGPSIRRQDLTLLRDEVTFVVNRFIHHEQAEAIDPSFYVIVDPKFGAGTWGEDFIAQVEKRLPHVEMLVGFDGDRFLRERGRMERHTRHVILPNQLFCFGYRTPIDLTRGIPGMDNVTKSAISAAVYMGFTEINLLGIDGNGLLLPQGSHFYGHVPGPTEQEELEKALVSSSMSMRSWRALPGYLARFGVSLVSRNPESVLTSLPFAPFEDAFKR